MFGPASSVAATVLVFRVDDRDRLVTVVRRDGVLAIVAHIDPPRILADADVLDDLVLARVDHAHDAERPVGGVEVLAVG
jgi:hypothetical protein